MHRCSGKRQGTGAVVDLKQGKGDVKVVGGGVIDIAMGRVG